MASIQSNDKGPLIPNADDLESQTEEEKEKAMQKRLGIVFAIYIVYAVGNRLFSKLQTVPMHNYPLFLSLLLSFFYIPVCFGYTFYQVKWGHRVTDEMRATPLYKFIIMGFFDATAGVMQTFGFNYIGSGGLIVLLLQVAIPISMLASVIFLKTKYKWFHYAGSAMVLGGLVIAVLPSFQSVYQCQWPTASNINNCPNAALSGPAAACNAVATESACVVTHPNVTLLHEYYNGNPLAYGFSATTACEWKKQSTSNPPAWIAVLAASCVPMALSNVYKEKALKDCDLDVMYLNAWVSTFQFLFSLPFTYIGAPLSGVDRNMKSVLDNLYYGVKCWWGKDTYAVETSKFCKDDCALYGPLYVWLYFVFNLAYNIFIILILKYGGATLFFVASVALVPLLNLAFSLPFIPKVAKQGFTWENETALVIIVVGLLIYRFWPVIEKRLPCLKKDTEESIPLQQ